MIALIAHPGAKGEVFNVGHTAEITIYDLARLVKEMTGSRSVIVLVPFERAYEPGFEDMQRRLPDISKLERLIGYRPSLNLRAMLQRIIAHYRTVLGLGEKQAREEQVKEVVELREVRQAAPLI
jgi:UDP-glucose 4-epimerase